MLAGRSRARGSGREPLKNERYWVQFSDTPITGCSVDLRAKGIRNYLGKEYQITPNPHRLYSILIFSGCSGAGIKRQKTVVAPSCFTASTGGCVASSSAPRGSRIPWTMIVASRCTVQLLGESPVTGGNLDGLVG